MASLRLLADSDIEEQLSLAYVRAVAARAGYTTAVPNPDRAGIDLCIQALGGGMRPAVDLQLKATISLGRPNGDRNFRFPLKSNNHNSLCGLSQRPRLLVVLDLPDNKDLWMTIDVEGLTLLRRAYWLSLRDHEETENKYSITVYIPEHNVFDVDGLHDIMQMSNDGVL
jgi:hypothetical protein